MLFREDAWPEDLARPRCVTCRLGHMFVTLWLVSPEPLFPLTCQVAVTGAGDCRAW
jgi:hypothetical protein